MQLKSFSLILILALMEALNVHAATQLDFQTVDRLTYQCYNEQKWDSVILVGKQALKQDIDYYYLRVRMGISYFNIKEYFPAVTHLEKARKFNSGDPFVTDYLYHAYINTNRNEEAYLLKSNLPPAVQDTAVSKPRLLQQVHFETGYTISSDRNPKNLSNLMGKDSIYGEQDLYGNNLYGNLDIQLRISDRFSFNIAYSYLNFEKTKYVQYGRAEAHRDSVIDNAYSNDYFYSYPWTIHDTAIKYNVKQHQAYLSAPITLPWGIKITPAFHWINAGYSMINTTYRTDSISDTAYFLKADSTFHLFRYTSLVYSFTRKDTAFTNILAALRISKDIGRFSIALSGSWSNLNGKTQTQAGIELTYFPLGNLNFYGTTVATGFFQGEDTRLLLSQVLGGKFTPWLWGEANLNYGDYTNANIANGAIVFNNSDKIDYRAGATFTFILNRHVHLSLVYQYSRKESQQLYYIKKENNTTHEIEEIPKTKYNPYNTNSIIGGITWKL